MTKRLVPLFADFFNGIAISSRKCCQLTNHTNCQLKLILMAIVIDKLSHLAVLGSALKVLYYSAISNLPEFQFVNCSMLVELNLVRLFAFYFQWLRFAISSNSLTDGREYWDCEEHFAVGKFHFSTLSKRKIDVADTQDCLVCFLFPRKRIKGEF